MIPSNSVVVALSHFLYDLVRFVNPDPPRLISIDDLVRIGAFYARALDDFIVLVSHIAFDVSVLLEIRSEHSFYVVENQVSSGVDRGGRPTQVVHYHPLESVSELQLVLQLE